MYNPPHPGKILKELCFEPLGLTIQEAANSLGIANDILSEIIDGKSGITPEIAVRLSIAFNTTSESWLNQQMQYDLWEAEKHRAKMNVVRLIA
jgi:addiction module HigA family antidote